MKDYFTIGKSLFSPIRWGFTNMKLLLLDDFLQQPQPNDSFDELHLDVFHLLSRSPYRKSLRFITDSLFLSLGQIICANEVPEGAKRPLLIVTRPVYPCTKDRILVAVKRTWPLDRP
jgi:hypothetical protein